MNLHTLFIGPVSTTFTNSLVIGANFFTTFNKIIAQAQTALNGLIIFLGVVIFLIGAARGKWTLPAILLSLLAGGLFIWGGISGVQWAADSAGSTIK